MRENWRRKIRREEKWSEGGRRTLISTKDIPKHDIYVVMDSSGFWELLNTFFDFFATFKSLNCA